MVRTMTNETRGLHLTRAHDAAALASAVARTLLRPVDDPFVQPLVLVPGAAVQRWLSQRVATAVPEGIRAGVLFAHPAALVPLLTGIDHRDDPWSPERLAWAVLDVVDAAPPGLEPLIANLAASTQRFANAARVAGLLGRYARHRPEMLAAWASGVDGAGLGFDSWQAVLWRALHEVVAGPDPVDRRAALVAGLRDGSVPVGWGSVALFRPRALAPSDLEVLTALATRVRVDAYAVVPGPGLAADLAPRLGRRGAEVVALLEDAADSVRDVAGPAPAPRIEVHASHGPDRQVEVLREVLTGLFADDPSLEPRDVAVACPDVVALAPHLQAAFTPADPPSGWQHPGRGLRVQVADRPASEANRLHGLLAHVVQLGSTRATASDLLAFAAHPFVARRFGFGPDELDRLGELVPRAAVRWGLNAAHRARFGLSGVAQGTWTVGVQRLLLGEALADDTLASLGRVAPVDVESTDVELVGSLAELVARVSRLASECLEPATGATWAGRFRAMLEQLASVPFDESWQLAQAWSVLEQLERRAANSPTLLGVADALALLDGEFRARTARPAFGNGSLVVGSLGELAAVPHRVVCLVGLDERTFPRRGVGDGDDLLRRSPAPGDPDEGADDRQHLWDALASARDRLVVVYRGRSTHTNEEQPPPAGLVDLIEASATPPVAEALQPFSPGYFGSPPRSFDRAALRAAEALQGPRGEPVDPFHLPPLPLAEPVVALELEALRQFVRHPARYFLRHRANLSLGDEDSVADELPIELDALQRWQVGARVLDALLARHPLEDVLTQELRRGEVPPGSLGSRVLDGIAATARQVVRAREPFVRGPAHVQEVDVEVGGVRLTGRAAMQGGVRLACEFGNVAPKHRAAAWVDALALTVQLGRPVDAVVVGGRRRHRLGAPSPLVAGDLLGQLAGLAIEGLQRVLPLPPRVCSLWASARATGQEPLADPGLRNAWRNEADALWQRFYPRGTDPWQARVGGQAWARPGEPSELGSLAAVVWAPIVRAES